MVFLLPVICPSWYNNPYFLDSAQGVHFLFSVFPLLISMIEPALIFIFWQETWNNSAFSFLIHALGLLLKDKCGFVLYLSWLYGTTYSRKKAPNRVRSCTTSPRAYNWDLSYRYSLFLSSSKSGGWFDFRQRSKGKESKFQNIDPVTESQPKKTLTTRLTSPLKN